MTNTRRAPLIVVVLVLVLGTVAPATAGSRAGSVSSGSIRLVAPAGWFTSGDGSVVARAKADLTAAIPSGPRAQIVQAPRHKAGVGAVVKRITAAKRSDPELVDGPTSTTLGAADTPATVITFSANAGGTRLVGRYVIVEAPGGQVTLVVLEAPEDQWDANVDTLMSVLAG